MISKIIKAKSFSQSTLIDMHVHTIESPCASITLDESLYLLNGIVDAICITDHDILSELFNDQCETLKEKYQISVLVPSVEISTYQGHVLAYGISKELPINEDAQNVIEIIHSEGGIAIAAHPYALEGIGDLIFNVNIDAIEINGTRTLKINQQAKIAAESMGIPLIGGSDSHNNFQVGTCVTEFLCKISTMKELLEAVTKGLCKPLLLQHK